MGWTEMPKSLAIAALTLALLAAGAYGPHTQIAPTYPANVTVVEKNQFWLSAGMTAAPCSRSLCQDV